MILGGLQILLAGSLIGGLWLIFIGLFMRNMAETGYQNLVLLRALEDTTVLDVATTNVVTVPINISIQQFVDDYLLRYGFRAFPVVEGDVVQGLISVSALKDLAAEQRDFATVRQYMRPLTDAIRIAPDIELIEALKRLAAAPGGRLLVMQRNKLIGLLTKSALARFVAIRNVLDEA
jgi:predicted transcriptional regulator